jgi:capsular polysaccharide export protein
LGKSTEWLEQREAGLRSGCCLFDGLPMPHRILFLQGPPSVFWRELSLALERRGHRVFKINVCLGDQIYWRRLRAANFRGRFKNWRRYLEQFVEDNQVTHILYYGDRLPYHVVAAEIAAQRGLVAVAIENGYLRPDWITCERGGMGAFSHFPVDPDRVLDIAGQVPEPSLAVEFPHTFRWEISNEIVYHLGSYFYRFLFPFYRSDKYYNPMLDYLGGIPRMWRRKANERQAAGVVDDLVDSGKRFYLGALQLQGDYQIRHNSPYDHLRTMIDEVTQSFARFAPRDSRLIFKIHPHDNGREAWPRVVAAAAQQHGVSPRVETIDGGDLDRLLAAARGLVTVNSTVGLHAIRARCPTKVLGAAIYNMPGLTHQGPLNEFWTTPQPVDGKLAAAFIRALAGTIQVKGSFHHPAGRAVAITEIVWRLEAGRINEPGAFVPSAPRLADARRFDIAAARDG